MAIINNEQQKFLLQQTNLKESKTLSFGNLQSLSVAENSKILNQMHLQIPLSSQAPHEFIWTCFKIIIAQYLKKKKTTHSSLTLCNYSFVT